VGGIRKIRPEERSTGQPTPGMTREEAIATPVMWSGSARTAPGMVSGWHHHGAFETSIYVLSGAARMEFGPGGREILEAGPGDFLYVPRGAIHRESNPSGVEAEIIVTRSGTGEPVVNVDGPEPG